MSKVVTFSDDVFLEPISSNFKESYETDITYTKSSSKEGVNSTNSLLPSIVLAVIAAIMVVYTAVAPNVFDDRRMLGIILLSLWSAMWALILWVIAKDTDVYYVWWILIIPVTSMLLFFILIIVMNIGVPEI